MSDVPSPYDYLKNYEGDPRKFVLYRRKQRIGQAFFNALNDSDKYFLQGTPYDPFHSDHHEDVEHAIQYLLEMGS